MVYFGMCTLQAHVMLIKNIYFSMILLALIIAIFIKMHFLKAQDSRLCNILKYSPIYFVSKLNLIMQLNFYRRNLKCCEIMCKTIV